MDDLFIIDEHKTYQRLKLISSNRLEITLPKLIDNLHNYNISFSVGIFVVIFSINNYKVIGPNRLLLDVKLLRSTVMPNKDLGVFIESYYDFMIISPSNPNKLNLVFGSAEDLYNCNVRDQLVGYWVPIEYNFILVPTKDLDNRSLYYIDTSNGNTGEVETHDLSVVDGNYVIKTNWFHVYYI